MLIGYARISTGEQNLDMQVDALKEAGCEKICTDETSGVKSKRPGLQEAFEYLREGDTLVVETIKPYPLQGSFISPVGKITERFTRWSDNEIFYEYTVDDPAIYTQPWSGEMSFYKETALFEYACHEGNYSLPGILGGARRAEMDAEAQ